MSLSLDMVMTALAVAKMLAEQGGQEAASIVQWLVGFAQNLAGQLGIDLGAGDGQGEMSNDSEEQRRFLLEVLQSIDKNNGDPHVIYPLLHQNSGLLNDGMIMVLRAWAISTLAEAEKDDQKYILGLVGEFGNLIQQFPLGNKAINMELGIVAYEIFLEMSTEEPKAWPGLQNNLANAYQRRIRGDRGENLEQSIACCKAALEVYTKKDLPIDWAMTQNNLGNAYLDRIRGDRAENLEQSIVCHEAALEINTKKDLPIYWAMTQNNLALALSERIKGDKGENLERSIACYEAALEINTKKDLPIDWAMTQNNLGNAYQRRIRGDRGENLEQSIACYKAALEVRTKKNLPIDWAMTQTNLAFALSNRIKGDRGENLERSIACYEAALEVRTKKDLPIDWAITQNNRAIAYGDRIKGDRAENLERSIACYEAALEVRTKKDLPIYWADTQNNLALALSDRIKGDRGENLERSIVCHEAALEVRTKKDLPIDWAGTQNNLATTYLSRIRGDRGENLELSIACHEAALEVYTKKDLPIQWAITQNNLATTYLSRIRGDRGENLERSIAFYEAALEIMTPKYFPIDCLNTSRNLGRVHFTQGNWQKAIATYKTAMEAVETSRSWSVDKDERQRIIREALSVYENTIQAQIKLGQIGEAIITSEKARSRQLVDFMAINDLYSEEQIPTEVQEYQEIQQQLQMEYSNSIDSTIENCQTAAMGNRSAQTISPLRRATIESLETRKQEVLQKIQHQDPVTKGLLEIEPIDLPTIQSLAITENTAILSFYTTDDDTHIFIIHPDREPQIHTCPGQGWKTLQQWLQQTWALPYHFMGIKAAIAKSPESKAEILTSLQESENAEYAEQLQLDWHDQMDEMLAEIADRLQLDRLISQHLTGIQELIVIPHLYLHQIPLTALPISTDITLGEKFTIRYAPSCQILKYCVDRPPIAIENYGTVEDADGTLPGAKFEGAQVAKLYNIPDHHRLIGKTQATVENYHNLLSQVQGVLSSHHASSNPGDPQQSCLQLSDGTISLREILRKRYPNLSEIFLSCCETNLGTTEITDDLLTLSTGFLCAGARTVISSLWAVDDIATAIFCRLYYQNRYFGDSNSRALQKAQTTLRLMSGDELRLNHIPEFKAHLKTEIKTTLADRKELKAQHQRGEISEEVFDREYAAFNKVYHKLNALLGTPEEAGIVDRLCQESRPFEHPYHWAGFICQGMA
jgi:CHAT domain-containing protein